MSIRQELRRLNHGLQRRRGSFHNRSDPLFARIIEWVTPGSVAIDAGAAVGTYTARLSELVGPEGWVFALEPIADQFELLAHNVRPLANVTCLQLAASDVEGICRMSAPRYSGGVTNWYQARIDHDGRPVLRVTLDSLPIPRPVSFLKIDTEGHDLAVLRGAEGIIERYQPTLYIEAEDATDWLAERGYGAPIVHPNSPDRVYLPRRHIAEMGLRD